MKDKLKILQTIHSSLCIGVIIAYLILGDLFPLENIKLPSIDSTSLMYILIPILSIILSNFIFKFQLKKTDPKLELEKKIPFYQTAMLMRLAVLEGPAFFILILLPDFLLFGILILLYMLYLRPTENQIIRDFESIRDKNSRL